MLTTETIETITSELRELVEMGSKIVQYDPEFSTSDFLSKLGWVFLGSGCFRNTWRNDKYKAVLKIDRVIPNDALSKHFTCDSEAANYAAIAQKVEELSGGVIVLAPTWSVSKHMNLQEYVAGGKQMTDYLWGALRRIEEWVGLTDLHGGNFKVIERNKIVIFDFACKLRKTIYNQ